MKDLDRLVKESGLDVEETKKKSKERQEKREKRSLKPLIFTAFGTLLLGLVLGVVLGVKTAPKETGDTSGSKYVVASMGDELTIDEQVTQVQNAQLDAIRTQYANMDDETKASGLILTKKYAIGNANTEAIKTLDPFFKEVMSVGAKPDAAKAKVIQKNTEEQSASGVDMQKKFAVNEVAKALGASGVKSGSVMPSLIGMDSEGGSVLLTVIPFTTKTQTVNATYMVRLDSSGKVQDYVYTGYISGDAKSFYEGLNSALKKTIVR